MQEGIAVVLKADELGSFFGLTITNSLLMTWIVMAIVIAFAYLLKRRLTLVPSRVQAGVEWAVEGALNHMTDMFGSGSLARRFFPIIASLFLFILAINELKVLPGVGSIGLVHKHELIPFLHAPTADLNFTLALAAVAFLAIEAAGVTALGFFKHAGKYVNIKSPIGFIVGLIEIISNLGRLISFSFRLFGNIFAGEALLIVAFFLVPYVVPAPLIMFEMFVGLVQAFVFAVLTLFFIKLAIVDPHEAH